MMIQEMGGLKESNSFSGAQPKNLKNENATTAWGS